MDKFNQTKSVLDFEMREGDLVPKGQYIGIFKDVQSTSHPQWGDGVMFIFEIVSGAYKGHTVTRIGKTHATKTNATGRMILNIVGNNCNLGRVDLRPYINKYYYIMMEETQNQKTRINSVWPYQSEPKAPQQPAQPSQRPNQQFQTSMPYRGMKQASEYGYVQAPYNESDDPFNM